MGMKMAVLFHATCAENAKSICESGLKISGDGITKGKVFLSTIPAHIFGCVCFKVTIPKEWVELHYGNWEYICKKDIPKEYIEFYSYEEDE